MPIPGPDPAIMARIEANVAQMQNPSGPKLYAVRCHDVWIVCRKRVTTAWDALSEAAYVGTIFGPEPPTEWAPTAWNSVPITLLRGVGERVGAGQ